AAHDKSRAAGGEVDAGAAAGDSAVDEEVHGAGGLAGAGRYGSDDRREGHGLAEYRRVLRRADGDARVRSVDRLADARQGAGAGGVAAAAEVVHHDRVIADDQVRQREGGPGVG